MDKSYWIKSKPVYNTLQWHDNATAHKIIASAEGGQAVVKLFQLRYPAEPVSVFYVDQQDEFSKYANILRQEIADDLALLDTEEAALAAFKTDLDTCYMGTQFYLAGSEVFIWEVLKSLKPYGVQDQNVAKEQCGSLTRAVYCVHCKTINKEVHNNIHQCTGCGRHLLVRDHFSRIHGAYMGFMIDAEDPGNLPEVQEIYP